MFSTSEPLGALTAALSVTDHPVSYVDLAGYGGMAFRMRWITRFTKKQCGSGAFYATPDEIEAIEQATGWRFSGKRAQWGRANCANITDFSSEIVSSLERGRPVVLDGCVIVGYDGTDPASRQFLVQGYGDEKPRVISQRTIGSLLIPDHWEDPPPPTERLAGSLRLAVTGARRENDALGYCYGSVAFDKWIADLAEVTRTGRNEHTLPFYANYWAFECLLDARTAADEFLRAHTADLGEDAAPFLTRASKVYRAELELLNSAPGKGFFGAWTPDKGVDDWTTEVREFEQTILSEARDLEKAAVQHLQEALSIAC